MVLYWLNVLEQVGWQHIELNSSRNPIVVVIRAISLINMDYMDITTCAAEPWLFLLKGINAHI